VAVSVVQSIVGLGAGNQTINTTLASQPAVGNYIFVAQDSAAGVVTGDTCTDNRGHTYTKAVSSGGSEIWYAKVSNNTTPFTVTTFGNGSSSNTNCVMEIAGADASSPIEATNSLTNGAFSFTSLSYAVGSAAATGGMALLLHQNGAAGKTPTYSGAMSLVASDVTGGTSSPISVGKASVTSAGSQTVSVSWSGADSYESVAVLIRAALVAPLITTQPEGQTGAVGGTATFTVAATASAGSLSYQWQSSTDGLSWSNVSGATSASYVTPTLASTDSGKWYRVTVTDSNGSVTSAPARLFITGLGSAGDGLALRGYAYQFRTWFNGATNLVRQVINGVDSDTAERAIWGAFLGFPPASGSGITGTSAVTLGAITTSAAGTVATSGAASQALGALTSSAAGTVAIVAASSQSLGALSSSSAGTVRVAGSSAQTLGPLTVAAAGATVVAGAASQALGAIAPVSAGTVSVSGASSVTLGSLTSSASGVVGTGPITGTSSNTLGALVSAAAGTVSVVGSQSATLGAVSSVSAGGVSISGASSLTLGAVTASGTGVLPDAGASATTLGLIGISSAGAVRVAGQGAVTLGSLVPSATGRVDVLGACAVSLGPLSIAATGQHLIYIPALARIVVPSRDKVLSPEARSLSGTRSAPGLAVPSHDQQLTQPQHLSLSYARDAIAFASPARADTTPIT